ncbi:MAG TPA: DUF2235 domain-containing protein [Vicinamibacterales bacterium]|nr:DUF2235 domain-containing protein [Vicinamibacterales bacterium]
MPKNIVICCDGTASEFARDNTNVVKLYSTLVQDQPGQCTYYHPGLGTMEPPGALTPLSRRMTRACGMAFGALIENDIGEAYVFLMQKYQPGDKVFFFGFSRGAYTVRATASLLRLYGLLRSGNEALVPYVVRMMMAVKAAYDTDPVRYSQTIDHYFELAAQFKSTMARECHPWFVGAWDTVSSVGWIEDTLRLPYVADNDEIQIGRHAVSIDEKRAFFRTNLWRPGGEVAAAHGPKDLLQVWFPGVHCDVGGGYPEAESGLSKLALEWMLAEAEQHGLKVDQQKRKDILGGKQPYVSADPDACLHNSLTGWWNLAEFVPKKHYNWQTKQEQRRMNLYRRRTIPPGSVIHWSVFERTGNYAAGINLPGDAIPFPKPPPGTD